jgi:hypothetical protein
LQLGAIPLQTPPQPARPQPAAPVADSVTCVPRGKAALQIDPQSIPDGELVTVPPGLPMTETDSAHPFSWKTVPPQVDPQIVVVP